MLRTSVVVLCASVLVACSGTNVSEVAPGGPSPAATSDVPAPVDALDAASSTTPNADAGGGDAAATTADYYPPAGDAWESVTPAKAGFDAAKLDVLSSFVEQSSSTTFIVLFEGRILVEKYWGATATTLRDIASAQKSISSLLVGAAVAQGAFGLDDTVTSILGDGWSNGTSNQEAPITVRHLLTMTSGLGPSLEYAAPPGTAWLYNTDAYHRLDLALTQKTGKTLQQYTRAALFDPIGAGGSTWTKRMFQKDAKGVPINALEMTARDMARVGLLVMHDGVWRDGGSGAKVLVPSAYLASALAPSQTLNPSYGFLFWLNGQPSALMPPSKPVSGMLFPSAPTDVVAALGASDQKIYVSRSSRLVVVRQGAAAGELGAAATAWDDLIWQKIMAAKLP